jgi:hypothetical protein
MTTVSPDAVIRSSLLRVRMSGQTRSAHQLTAPRSLLWLKRGGRPADLSGRRTEADRHLFNSLWMRLSRSSDGSTADRIQPVLVTEVARRR